VLTTLALLLFGSTRRTRALLFPQARFRQPLVGLRTCLTLLETAVCLLL